MFTLRLIKNQKIKKSKMRRSYSTEEILAMKFEDLSWSEKFSDVFGTPAIDDTWLIWGASGSGKSSFVMQLAKELAQIDRVLYVNYEEGVKAKSYQKRLLDFNMKEHHGRFTTVLDSYEELSQRLAKQRSGKFVIIDSIQMSGWTYSQAEALIKRFPKKAFIFISQEDKGNPLGLDATRLLYLASVKIKVAGYRAYSKGRYSENPAVSFPVWQKGIIEVTNNI